MIIIYLILNLSHVVGKARAKYGGFEVNGRRVRDLDALMICPTERIPRMHAKPRDVIEIYAYARTMNEYNVMCITLPSAAPRTNI